MAESAELDFSTSGRPFLAAAWILRVGMSGCFIGHGMFGIITKAAWIPYFGVAGISSALSWRLMPLVGAMDICIGILLLLRPTRALLLWACVWTIWTALLRPLSGESSWEFWERAGNFVPPLACLFAAGLRGPWFQSLRLASLNLSPAKRGRIFQCLQMGTASLLMGHAGYALFLQKPTLIKQYAAIGLTLPQTVTAVGLTDLALAIAILARPNFYLLIGICLWKISSEALYPISGSPIWEFVERFGSYAVPLSMAFLLVRLPRYANFSQTTSSLLN